MKNSYRKAALILALALGGLVSVLLIRAGLPVSTQIQAQPGPLVVPNMPPIIDHLAQSVRLRTVSTQDPSLFPGEAFLKLQNYLAQVFPHTHKTLRREVVADYSLLFTWPGHNPHEEGILLLAHLDVVPVETGSHALWKYPPYSGAIAEGAIWGRGSLDDKASVLAILEAVEMLLAEGIQLRRTLYLAFGHDEEIGGKGGAATMASLLKARGVQVEFALDEGGAITEGMVPGISNPVALVGIAEKGYLSLKLSVQGEGGHSSIPPPHTAVGILSSAIHRLEGYQFESRIDGTTGQLLKSMTPHLPFSRRLVLENLWLLGGFVIRELASDPKTNAAIRTTLAVTQFNGGIKDNVLPLSASAVVNFRILPGDTSEGIIDQVNQVIDDPRVTIHPVGPIREPSSESSLTSYGFKALEGTIGEVFPHALVMPYLVFGGTDSYHYKDIATNIYRFSPLLLKPDDFTRIHGTNERIPLESYRQCIRFYYHLIKKFAV